MSSKQSKPVFYIDPQSMRNLSIYDYCLMEGLNVDVMYFCSKYYDYKYHRHIKYLHIFKYNLLKNNILKVCSYIGSCIILLFYIAKYRPQTIHIQWLKIPRFEVCFYKAMKRLFHLKLIFTAHNILPHDTGEKYKEVYGKVYQQVDHIIVHTNDTKEKLLQAFPVQAAKISVIRHGILELNPPHVDSAKTDLFRSHYQLEGKLVFSVLGYLYNYKGVDAIAKVWAQTKELRNNPSCMLVIAGMNKGVDLSALEGINNVCIEDRRIPDDEFYYLLHQTDVLLLPYRSISQSGLLLTAINEHIPVLVTEVGGLTEPFDVADIGWKITETDSEELRKTLIFLSENPQQAKAKKNDSTLWEKACHFYDWKTISQQTEHLYTSI